MKSVVRFALCLAVFLLLFPTLANAGWTEPGFYEKNGEVRFWDSNPPGSSDYGWTFIGGTGGGGGGDVENNNTNTNSNFNLNSNSNKNTNSNTNFNSNSNKNYNTNVQGQSQGQGQTQGQGQGQSQSMSNSGNQKTTVKIKVDAPEVGAFRQLPGPGPVIEPRFSPPPAEKDRPMGYVPTRFLPTAIDYEEAEQLSEDASADVSDMLVTSNREQSFDIVRKVPVTKRFKGFVTGYSNRSSSAAYNKAALAAMRGGADTGVLANSGAEGTPRAFFVGLGGAGVESKLEGNQKDRGWSATGSGLIGFTKGGMKYKFFYTFAVYGPKSGKKMSKAQPKDPYRCIETGTYKPPADCR